MTYRMTHKMTQNRRVLGSVLAPGASNRDTTVVKTDYTLAKSNHVIVDISTIYIYVYI